MLIRDVVGLFRCLQSRRSPTTVRLSYRDAEIAQLIGPHDPRGWRLRLYISVGQPAHEREVLSNKSCDCEPNGMRLCAETETDFLEPVTAV